MTITMITQSAHRGTGRIKDCEMTDILRKTAGYSRVCFKGITRKARLWMRENVADVDHEGEVTISEEFADELEQEFKNNGFTVET